MSGTYDSSSYDRNEPKNGNKYRKSNKIRHSKDGVADRSENATNKARSKINNVERVIYSLEMLQKLM